MQERIQKIIAQAGIASRRRAEELISKGRVLVNGKVAVLGQKADAAKDKIVVNGQQLRLEKKVYIMLNKPKGYVTTVSEAHGMKTIMDLVDVPERVFPVGRLDKNTEGLLLLTNDGILANKLTHPRYEVEKEYIVTVDKNISERILESLQKGVVIDGRKVQIRGVDVLGSQAVLRIHEGRKHIVRRLFEELGLYVRRLVRTRVGKLKLGALKPAKWRYLAESEVRHLLEG
ncbi:MAG: pseudouridine synthase [Candidatus Woesearchaeota archaeon]